MIPAGVVTGLRTAWTWLRGVPAWVWTVLAFLLALWALRLANRRREKALLLAKEYQLLKNYQARVAELRWKREQALEVVRESHKEKVSTLQDKDVELAKKAGDVEAITDAVNDAFGDD